MLEGDLMLLLLNSGFRPAMNINCKEAIKWISYEFVLISALHFISCLISKISLKHKSFSELGFWS